MRNLLPINKALGLLSLVLALNSFGQALAVDYTFSRVYTGSVSPGVAINDNGLVALTTDTGLLTTDGKTSTTIASFGSAGPNYLDNADFMRVLAINNNGFVAFRGHSVDGGYGVLTSDGLTTRTIATVDAFDLGGCSALSINDSGTVAFSSLSNYSSQWEWGTFQGDGTAATQMVGDYITDPAISNSGIIAYHRYDIVTGECRLEIKRGSQTLCLPDLMYFNSLQDINNQGIVAYMATVGGVPTIAIGDGISPSTYIDTSAYKGELGVGYAFDGGLSDCAINDQGTVVFGACRDAHGVGAGIFVGPDPEADKVIMQGDALDGSTVAYLHFSRNGLNNKGQIAFYASLSDGSYGVFIATPVPEPSAVVMVLVFGCSLLLCRWRRRDA